VVQRIDDKDAVQPTVGCAGFLNRFTELGLKYLPVLT
jgi:hypothetical protein